MEVVIVDDPQTLGEVAGGLVVDAVRRDPALVLGVATGSSPLPVYAALVEARRDGVDFSQMRCVALDEYLGLDADDPASYRSFVRREVAAPLGVRPEHVLVPDGTAPDPAAACAAFEEEVRRLGGVAVQLLGIGRNGHVGFNEPGSSFASRTRLARLSETTRQDNARFFDDPGDVPTSCLTQGLGTILEARRLLLVAAGAHKTAAVTAAVEGPVTEDCPASALQLHADAIVVVDTAAGAGLVRSGRHRSATTRSNWLH